MKVFGMSISPFRLVTKYLEGAFHIGENRLYVSRGLDTTGTPVRIGSRPELTAIPTRSDGLSDRLR